MRRKTLLALGIAGVLASGSASAATFLCAQDDANASLISCAEIPSAVLDTMATAESAWAPSPPFVAYYLMQSPENEMALMEFTESVEPHYVEPTAAGAIDLSSPQQWSHSEPRTITYLSHDSTSASPGSGPASIDLSSADQWQHAEPRTVTYLSGSESLEMDTGAE